MRCASIALSAACLPARLHGALQRHSHDEELEFAVAGYAKREEHEAEHKAILDELQMVLGKLEQGERAAAETTLVLNTFVFSVAIGHVARSEFGALAKSAVD